MCYTYWWGVIAVSALSSCQDEVSATSNSKSAVIARMDAIKKQNFQKLKDSFDDVPNSRVGFGFDSRSNFPLTIGCLKNSEDPSAVVYSNPSSSFSLSSEVSSSDVADTLGVSASGKGSYGPFSGSFKARYAKETIEKKNSLNFNFMQSFDASATQKNPGFGTGALSEDGKAAYAAGAELFANYCGDSYVDKANVGGLLIVSAEIDFGSTSQKESMGAEVKASMAGLGSVKAAFDKARSLGATNAKLKISAIQLGGNASHLIDVLGNPDASGKYAAVECSGGNTDACSAFVNKIIDYARGDFKKTIDFDNPNDKKADYYYVFNSHLKKFKDIGVAASLPDLSPETQAAKDYLVDQVKADTEMLDYLQRYQQQEFYASLKDPVFKGNITQATKDYTAIVEEYTKYSLIDACYGGIADINTECIKAANRVKVLRAKYATSIYIAENVAIAMVYQSPIGFVRLVNIYTGRAVSESEIQGQFFIVGNDNDIYKAGYCWVDQSVNNNDVGLKGLTALCFFNNSITHQTDSFYIKRYPNLDIQTSGIFGKIINGEYIDYPVNSYHNNVNKYYSTSKDFKYNPI